MTVELDRALRDAAERMLTLSAVFEVRGEQAIADELLTDAELLYDDALQSGSDRGASAFAAMAFAKLNALERIAGRL